MVKRIVALAAAVLLTAALSCTAFAEVGQVRIEQIYGNLPQIDLYCYFQDANGAPAASVAEGETAVTVLYNDEQLEVESCAPAKAEGTVFYFLLDISSSMPQQLFDAAKQAILDWYTARNGADRVVLITFGSEVRTVVSGGETPAEAKKILDALKPDNTQTRFFDAVSRTLSLAEADDGGIKRKVAVVITDGEDYYKGGATSQEIKQAAESGNLPIFAMGVQSAAKEYLDALGELSRASGGYLSQISAANAAERFGELSAYLDGCYLIKTKTASNIVTGGASQIILRYDGGGSSVTARRETTISRWQKDAVPPELELVALNGESLEVAFSEPVLGAENLQAYSLCDASDAKLEISEALYDAASAKATLKLARPIYNGEYKLAVSGITDASAEKNAVSAEPYSFAVEDKPYTLAGFLADNPLVIAAAAALLVAAAAAIILTAKKKRARQEQEQGGLETDQNGKTRLDRLDGMSVRMAVTDSNKLTRTVDIFVRDSIVIGRSRACNISIDDPQIHHLHPEQHERLEQHRAAGL